MKKFTLRLLLFIAPIFSISTLIEYKLQNDDSSYYALKRKAFECQIDTCKTLVFGSSSENSGINPNFLKSKGLNLAFVGSTSIDMFYLLTKRYINDFKSLKTVIIPMSLFSFYANEDRENLQFRRILLKRNFDLYETTFNNPIKSLMLTNLGLTRSFKRITRKQNYNINEYGFEKREGSNANQLTLQQGKRTVIRHIGKNLDDLDPDIPIKNTALLDELIAMYIQKNIRVIIISSPTHWSYYKNVNDDTKKYAMLHCSHC